MKASKRESISSIPIAKSRISSGLFTSRTEEWQTPHYLFNALDSEFHFQVDVCATSENAKCQVFFDKNVDGLKREWSPFRCWMNPPYGKKIDQWMHKAYKESQRGALVVCLIPARTDTQWWHEWVMKSAEIRFVRGRISFGDGKQSAPFPSCISIFYPEFDNPYKMSVPIIKSVRFDKATQKMRVLNITTGESSGIDNLF